MNELLDSIILVLTYHFGQTQIVFVFYSSQPHTPTIVNIFLDIS